MTFPLFWESGPGGTRKSGILEPGRQETVKQFRRPRRQGERLRGIKNPACWKGSWESWETVRRTGPSQKPRNRNPGKQFAGEILKISAEPMGRTELGNSSAELGNSRNQRRLGIPDRRKQFVMGDRRSGNLGNSSMLGALPLSKAMMQIVEITGLSNY